MIGHYLEYIDVDAGMPRIQVCDDGMHHRPGFAEEHSATCDATETRGAVLCYDGYEIRACMRIVVTS